MIFSVYLQVGDLERSLSFYRDGLGLEVAWNDETLAVLRGTPESAATLAIREVSGSARPGMGEAGVARLGWQVTSWADLDSAEQRLAALGVQYRRADEMDGGRIETHDPDGLRVVLFLPSDPSLTRKPPLSLTSRPAPAGVRTACSIGSSGHGSFVVTIDQRRAVDGQSSPSAPYASCHLHHEYGGVCG